MLRKDRVKKAIAHQEVDIVPHQFFFMPQVIEGLAKALDTQDLDETVGNHFHQFTVGSICGMVSEPIGKDLNRDEWGVVWKAIPETSAFHIIEHPLTTPSLKGYRLPNPYSAGRFDKPLQKIVWERDRFVLCCIGSLFETAYTLRGMEDLFIDMYRHPTFIHDLLEAILEFDLAILDQALNYPIDGVYLGDDYGTQADLMMNPKMWRTFIKPRLTTIIERTHAAGLPFFLHSDGNISSLLTDLVDIGVDVIHPIQEEAMDIYWVKKEYGRDLCLYGGIGEQGVFYFGTPKEVMADVRHKLKTLGEGSGYILSPGIHIIPQIPKENVLAVVDAVNNQSIV